MILLSLTLVAVQAGGCPPVLGGYGKTVTLKSATGEVVLKVKDDELPEPLPVVKCDHPTVYVVVHQGQKYVVSKSEVYTEQTLAVCVANTGGTSGNQTPKETMLALNPHCPKRGAR